MNFREKKNKSFEFNMSSMTDIVFLLLIFFMLTSNFATPSGVSLNVPTSKNSKKVLPKITVSITKDLRYFVNQTEVFLKDLEYYLKNELPKSNPGSIVLAVDKDVPVQYLIDVASIATALKVKVAVSTRPINR